MSDHQRFWKYADNLMKDLSKDRNLFRKMVNASTDEETIQAVKSRFSWTPSALKENQELQKSSAKSMKYAEEAIKAANYGQRSRSLKLANMITAFAEDAGDLALGHSIRFQLFDLFGISGHQKIEELELCIKRPQRAKKINADIKLNNKHGEEISPNFTKKELTRFLKEFRAVRKSPEAKKYYDDIEKQDDKRRNFTRDLFTLKSPNPKAPALEDFVEIKYNSVKGRHLVVTQDVPAGTTLFVDKPFVAGLGNVFALEIDRCHNCFKKEFVPVPCPNCVFVLYCSQKCLEESKEYHKKYECSIYPDLHAILSSVDHYYWFLCAYSAICTFGPQKIFHAFQQQQQQVPKKKDDCEIPGVDPETGIYDSSSFYTISQAAKITNCSPKEAVIALASAKILETRTPFFEQLESELESSELKAQFKNFVTLSIVKISHSYSVHKSRVPEYYDEPFGPMTVYAFSLQPTHTLSNHSCDGNLATGETSNLKGIGSFAVALRDLKKGEELCRTYGTLFSHVKKPVRQAYLSEEFKFVCECAACLNDWPLMGKMEAEKDCPKFCCPLCSHKIPPQPEMMTKKNYDKIALNSGNNFTCSQCKSEYKEKELMTQFKRHSMALNIAENLIKKGTGQETLKSLKAASSFFQNHLIPPSFYQQKCQVLIFQATSITLIDD